MADEKKKGQMDGLITDVVLGIIGLVFSLGLAGGFMALTHLTGWFALRFAPWTYILVGAGPVIWGIVAFIPHIKRGVKVGDDTYSYKEPLHLFALAVIVAPLFFVETAGSGFFTGSFIWVLVRGLLVIGYIADCAILLELAALSVNIAHNKVQDDGPGGGKVGALAPKSLIFFLIFMPLFIFIVFIVMCAFWIGELGLMLVLPTPIPESLEVATVYPLAILGAAVALVFGLIFLAISWIRG